MRRKKGFTKAKGVYYFNVLAGYKSSITISRATKEEAEFAYAKYLKQKKVCEWLGLWDGKEFKDTTFKKSAA